MLLLYQRHLPESLSEVETDMTRLFRPEKVHFHTFTPEVFAFLLGFTKRRRPDPMCVALL